MGSRPVSIVGMNGGETQGTSAPTGGTQQPGSIGDAVQKDNWLVKAGCGKISWHKLG